MKTREWITREQIHKAKRTGDRTFVLGDEEQDSKGQREAAFKNVEDPGKYIFIEVKGRDSFREGMVERVISTRNIVESHIYLQGLCGFVRDTLINRGIY